ncbi:MAG: tandem-95 repeat protein [Gammaproteobacteria bacterium]|nr:tandem-95 repeat protein [Gammaproteobacteria bacterium]MBU1725882.1 tandem-95 repeat protein [Gammaproteobacteria bacterium]MBU2006006.1 tandem-95 repeat protein [Gammaproteobacteria bacterium]
MLDKLNDIIEANCVAFPSIRSLLPLLLFALLGLLSACGGGGGSSTTVTPPIATGLALSGAGQKGIFLAGSAVEAFPLDTAANRTGSGVVTQTDANGQYTLTLPWTGWTEIQISGQYFDEYNGNNSITALTLQGITNIGSAHASSNVNLFTHMVASRIRTLVAGGASLADASNTAHAALRQTFSLSAAVTDAGSLNLTDGNSSFANENAALLRFSGSFQAVGGNAVESVLQNLTNDFTNNGQFDGLGQAEFNNIRAVAADPATTARLRENLRERGFDNPPAPPNDDSNDPGWGTPNHAPIATAAIINATEDTPKTFTLAGTDADTDTLTFVDVSTPNHGTVSVNPNTGVATYTPAANFSGEDTFTFKVFDRLVKSAAATVTVNVAAMDDLPTVANPIADLAVNEDAASRVIDLSHVFQDVDGDAITLTVQNNNTPTLVTPSLNGTNLTLAFATNRNGTATITIRATANGQTVDDSFTVTVNPEGDAPVVTNPIGDVTTTEDASDGSINLNNVFADGDGDSITLSVQGNTNSALVTPTLNGTTLTLDYLPDAYGTADITIRAMAGGLSVDDTFRVTVSAVDDAPRVANSIADVPVNEDAANTSISLGNVFSDPENDSITLSVPTNTNAALVTPTLNGTTLTLAYAADGYGSANITVRATANGKMVEDTFAVTVNAVSDPPTANNMTVNATEDTAAEITLNGGDSDNIPTYHVVGNPSHGRLDITSADGKSVRYTPDANYNGEDSFTYRVRGGATYSSLATITINIAAASDAPSAAPANAAAVAGDGMATVSWQPVAGATGYDICVGTASITDTSNCTRKTNKISPAAVTGLPNGTTHYFRVIAKNADGESAGSTEVTVTPQPQISATGGSFCKIVDGGVKCWTAGSTSVTTALNAGSGATAIAGSRYYSCAVVNGGVRCSNNWSTQQTIDNNNGVTAVAGDFGTSCAVVNGGVKCSNVNFTTDSTWITGLEANSGVTAIATGTSHSCALARGGVKCWGSNTYGQVGNGTLVSGTSLYQTIPENSGATAITAGYYSTCALVSAGVKCWGANGWGQLGNGSNTQTSTPADVSTLNAGSGVTAIETGGYTTCAVVAGGVKCWGADHNNKLGDGGAVVHSSVPVQMIPVGNGSNTDITATVGGADDGTTGGSFCALQVNGGTKCWGGSNTTPVPGPTLTGTTTAGDVSTSTNEDVAVEITLTGTASSNDTLGFSKASDPAHGTITINGNKASYVPATNWHGTDTFTYKATDGMAESAAATVTITVNPVNDAPVANVIATRTVVDTAKTITLTGTDVENSTLTFSAVTQPEHGSLSNVTNGSITYTPTSGYVGEDSFTYKANDGSTDSSSAAVSISVVASNTAPVAGNLTISAEEEVPKEITLAGSDTNGDALDFIIVTQPTNGILSPVTIDGKVTYTSNLNFHGNDSFTYKASDGSHDSAVATVSLTVADVGGDAPPAPTNLVAYAGDGLVRLSWGAVSTATSYDICRATASISSIETCTTVTDGSVSTSQTNSATITGTPNGIKYYFKIRTRNSEGVSTDSNEVNATPQPQISATGGSFCKIVDGGVKCWTAGSTSVTTTLNAGSGATAIAGSRYASCAVVNGGVRCSDNWSTQRTVDNGNGVTAVAGDYGSSCAVVDGGVKCSNVYFSSGSTWVTGLEAGSGVTAIATGTLHSCAVVRGGVKCWGDNGYGQRGNGSLISGTSLYQVFPEGAGATGITTGYYHTCTAINGGVKCWGSAGNLGDGSSSHKSTPVDAIAQNSGVTAIESGGSNTCAVINGGVKCWGNDANAKLGNGGSNAASLVPVQTIAPGNGSETDITALAGGADDASGGSEHGSFCALQVNGGLKCWGGSNTTPITGPILNGTPTANSISVNVHEDTTTTISLNALDPDGNTLTYAKVADPTNGTVSINSTTGVATYTPAANFNGTDSFTYRVNDGTADSATTTVTITVTSVYDPPVVNPVTARVIKNIPKSITFNGSGDGTLTYSIINNPTHGTLGAIANGRVTYTPTTDYIDSDSFTYQVNNGTEDSAPATVSITVKAENDAPIANAGANFSVYENTASVALNCLGTDTDSDTLTYTWTAPNSITLSGADTATATFNAPQLTTASIDLTFTCAVSDGTTTISDSVVVTVRDDIIDPTPTGWLNDTGVTTWGNASDNTQVSLQTEYPGQDADYGRDTNANTNSDTNGHAGFNFTKIGADGQALAIQNGTWSDNGSEAAGTKWSCVKDNNTGLIWEVKSNDGGLHDKDWTYNWYQPDSTKNGGAVGYTGGNTCGSTSACNTLAYVTAVNAVNPGWCDANDWRMPTVDELLSIIALNRSTPAIDVNYFPNTLPPGGWYWTSAPNRFSDKAWGIYLNEGRVGWTEKNLSHGQILVRDGQ